MGRVKKGLIHKTLERCRSFGQQLRPGVERHRVAPEGCFTVCVGPEKDRFAIKTKCVNHPLFKLLLDEAETEYGFSREGPVELPCEVDLFLRVLWEIEEEDEEETMGSPGCGLTASPSIRPHHTRGFAGYQMLSPAKKLVNMTG